MLSSLSQFPNTIFPQHCLFLVFHSLRSISLYQGPNVIPIAFTLPEHRIVLGCGAVAVDFLATVASYPNPDDKIRSTSFKVQGGGNAGNALTCAARLRLNPRLISKVANDAQGKSILEELEDDGVNTSFFIVFSTMFAGSSDAAEMDVHSLLESLKRRKDDSKTIPKYKSLVVTKLSANGIGTVTGRLFVGTAEKIPQSELVDTTGAGDAFIGAVVYALCAGMPPEKMLPFAAQVVASGCRALGARAGLPHCKDPRLATFL